MSRIVLIDSDSLCYQSSKETLEESINIIDEKISNIFIQTKADNYVMFISMGKYFRHALYPEYKANRGKYGTPLKWLTVLKAYLIDKYGAINFKGVEADDLVAYYHNYYTVEHETIIASADKDVLKSIPGKHFNYSYHLPNKEDVSSLIKGTWVETSEEDASKFQAYQLIAGDAGDNIVSPFPENCAIYNQELSIPQVLEGYINGLKYVTPSGMNKFKEGLGVTNGIYQFQKNYRLLHLLNCSEDFMREVGDTPLPLYEIIKPVPTVLVAEVPKDIF